MWIALCAAWALIQIDPASQPVDDSLTEVIAPGAPDVVSRAQLSAAERARQLISHGDSLGLSGHRTPQHQAYRRALELDPHLASDPSFIRRFEQSYIEQRRAAALAPPRQTALPPPAIAEQPGAQPPAIQQPTTQQFPRAQTQPQRQRYIRAPRPAEPLKPRQGRYIGAALTTGPAAITGLGITSYPFQHLQLTVFGDFWIPAISVDAKVHFLSWYLTPYVGGGVHLALPVNVPAPAILDNYRTGYLYATAGLQYMSDSGFYIDAGIALSPGLNATPGRSGTVSITPSLSLGWAFRMGPVR